MNNTISNINPSTGELISKIPKTTVKELDVAIQRAQSVQKAWAQRTDIPDILERIADKIIEYKEKLAFAESQDTGKPLHVALNVDIDRAAQNFRFFAGQLRHDHMECYNNPGNLNYTTRSPIGVVGLITPWNLPLYLLTWKLAPALGMGNVVIAKPSEFTPTTATMLIPIMIEAGVPEHVFQVLHGYGNEIGAAIVAHPSIPCISFTGGTKTGQIVAQNAGRLFKKVSLLGGKNPSIVFDDCDIDKTICGTIRSAFLNSGQICLCGSRLFVQNGIYETFVEKFIEATKLLKVGDPMNSENFMGSLISKEHRDKVQHYVEVAKESGNVVGGEAFGHAFFSPTVITGLSPSSRVSQEEIFGPVVTIHPFETEDEVVELANGVPYGLAASVWTSNLSVAHRVSTRLQVGMVWVNCWLVRDLRTPFGGVKDSGIGREGGRHSLDFFSETKNICISLFGI